MSLKGFDYDLILGLCCEMPVGYVQIRLPIGVAGPFWKNKPSSFTRFRFQKLTADLGIAVDRFRRLRPKPSIISTVLICASKTSGSRWTRSWRARLEPSLRGP
ncbi:unnamed protein product [Rhodiola kirilowii]